MPDEKIITVTKKEHAWGRKDLWEPVCDQAKAFTRLTRLENLTTEHLGIIRDCLGYEVKSIMREPTADEAIAAHRQNVRMDFRSKESA